jgi:hypothetical protein
MSLGVPFAATVRFFVPYKTGWTASTAHVTGSEEQLGATADAAVAGTTDTTDAAATTTATDNDTRRRSDDNLASIANMPRLFKRKTVLRRTTRLPHDGSPAARAAEQLDTKPIVLALHGHNLGIRGPP